MDFDLERFIKAQDAHGTYDNAINELVEGEKQSHWMWFVFPQMKGLGHSPMAHKYGISSVYEAHAYLNHLELRGRLYNAVNVLNDNNYGKEIESVLGSTDAMKLKSCLTLFDTIEPDSVFDKGLRYFFDDERDELTLKLIGKDLRILDEDVWEEYNSSFTERAYFDDYCHEANGLSSEARIATFLDLKKRDYKIITITWHYLLAHSDLFDNYRTSNTETAIVELKKMQWGEVKSTLHNIGFLPSISSVKHQHSHILDWMKDIYIDRRGMESLYAFEVGDDFNNRLLSE